MQKIKDIRLFLKADLGAQYPDSELRGFLNWILEYVLDFSVMDALMNAEDLLKPKDIKEVSRIGFMEQNFLFQKMYLFRVLKPKSWLTGY